MTRDYQDTDLVQNTSARTDEVSRAETVERARTKAEKAFDIASAIAQGDAIAETRMVELYEPALRRILRTRTNGKEELEDLTQEVWMQVLPKLRENALKNPAALPGFLNSFARKVAANHQRKKETLASKNKVADPEVHWPTFPDLAVHLANEQLLELVNQLIDELPMERDRQVLRRFLILEESKADLCKEFAINARIFSSVLSRARQRLSELISKHLDDPDQYT